MHIPRKRFGQHFLEDESIIHRIVASLAPQPTDHLVEIGPGQGALTLPVLRRVKQLEVVELDRDLVPILEQHAKDLGELKVFLEMCLILILTNLKQTIDCYDCLAICLITFLRL